MESNSNYYEILGVSKNASQDEIKRAYYTLSKKYHPDVNSKTANLFRNITDAYNTLKDDKKRKKYDELLDLGAADADNLDYADIFTNSFKDTYYENPEYYQDPHKEPIVNILDDFWKYRFENATSAIWDRNVFVLITNFCLCFIIFNMIGINRIVKLFNKEGIKFKSYKNIWIEYIIEAIKENNWFRYTCWTGYMFALASSKVIYHIAKIIYWIFAKVIKYFLIPIAMILSALILKRKY